MESPLLIALSGADVLRRRMDVVANNIANSTTAGFRREDTLLQTARVEPKRNQPLDFVMDRATYRDLSQGAIQQTGNELDVALTGPGFLSVRNTDGSTVYTRAGSMKLNPEGNLVDASGNTILSDGNDVINIPDTVASISIAGDGTISGEQGVLGKLAISEISNAQELSPIGNNYFKLGNKATATPAVETALTQGAIEGSNVKPVVEMTQMMEISRRYQAVANIMEQEHDRIRSAIRTLGKVV